MEIKVEEITLPIGTTVTYSDKAKKQLRLRYPDRIGIISGISRTPNCLRVLWEGRKKPDSFHRSFLIEVKSSKKYAVWSHSESDEIGVISESEMESFSSNGLVDFLHTNLSLEEANKIGQQEADIRNFTFHKLDIK